MSIIENSNIFKCPVCGSAMHIFNQKSLICAHTHCFDLAKTGYINLLLQSSPPEYDKVLLKSRQIICNSGFFAPLVQQISAMIVKEMSQTSSSMIRILDAGCGEGSHLAQVISQLTYDFPGRFQGIGMDISKAGIQMAAKQYPSSIWCVGDLAQAPLRDKEFEVILNILSPANYSEFNRIMAADGLLIKVVPESDYLQELRALFFDKTARETYSNENVIELFHKNYKLITQKRITYQVKLAKANLEHLIKMTPLSWRASDEKIAQALDRGIDKITVDLSILGGKNPHVVDPA